MKTESNNQTAITQTGALSTGGAGASASQPLLPPPVMPDHELLRPISREGAYGEVWLARNVIGNYRAVKVVHRRRFRDDGPYNTEYEGLRRFYDISREHAGFVDILHVSRNDSEQYFAYVMELADDLSGYPQRRDLDKIDPEKYVPSTLSTLLDRRRRLPPRECVELAADLAEGLMELHRHGLVHRDIKPANTILVKGRARIGDIGLVAEVSDKPPPSVGTPGYMDEELHGTTRGDLYSFGKVLYVMATGQPPTDWPNWPAEDTLPEEDLPGLRELNEVFLKACDPDRSRRYQTAQEIHADLLLIKAGKSIKHLLDLERMVAAFRRYGIAAALIAVLVGVVFWQYGTQRRQAAELLQRQVGLCVAQGLQAAENKDWAGALPWFVEALERDRPEAGPTHRVRFAVALRQAPVLVQMWQGSAKMTYAEFGTNSLRVLGSDLTRRWTLRDLRTGHPLSTPFGRGAFTERAHLSPHGDRAVTCTFGDPREPACVWDVNTGQLLYSLATTGRVYHAAFSPDGFRIVTTGEKGSVNFWNASTGESQLVLRHQDAPVLHAAFSSDGRRLATGASDSSICLWDLTAESGPPTHRMSNHKGWVYHLAFSPDGQTLASGSGDGDVRLWNAETGEAIGQPLHHSDWVRSVEFSADGQRLVTAAWDFAAHIWDVASAERLCVLPHNSKVMYAAFSPEGRHVMTVSYDGMLRLWRLKLDVLPPASEPVAVSPDGGCLVRFQPESVEFVEPATGQTVGALALTNRTPSNTLLNSNASAVVTLDPDGTTNSRQARLWLRTSAAPVGVPITYNKSLSGAVLSGSGERMAVFGRGHAQIFNLTTGQVEADIETPQGGRFARAVFAPGETRLLLAQEREFQIWDLQTRRPTGPPGRHALPISSVEFNADGRWVVSACSDQTLTAGCAQVWESATGQPVGKPLFHRDGVPCARFNPDSSRLVTCGEDYAAVIHETRTGRQTAPALRHKSQVLCVAFSPDGRWLATGCANGDVRVWDVQTGEPVTPSFKHPNSVGWVRFAGRSQLVAEASARRARILLLPSDDRPASDLALIARLCSAQGEAAVDLESSAPQTTLQEVWQHLSRAYPEEFSLGAAGPR